MSNIYTYEVDHGDDTPAVSSKTKTIHGRVIAVSFQPELDRAGYHDELVEALKESTKQLRDGVVRADSPKSRQIHRNEELLREIREGK